MSIMDNYKNNICCNKNCVNRTEDKRVFCDDCLEESNKDIKIIPKNYEVTLEGESINVNKSIKITKSMDNYVKSENIKLGSLVRKMLSDLMKLKEGIGEEEDV